jgi:hypothetical protein
MGRVANRHLASLAEPILVKVAGSDLDAKGSPLSMPEQSVGGVIMLGGRESLPQEGRQGIDDLRGYYLFGA